MKSHNCLKEVENVGNGGMGSTKNWYTGWYCSGCKKMFATTDDGRHETYLKKDTQKYLKLLSTGG